MVNVTGVRSASRGNPEWYKIEAWGAGMRKSLGIVSPSPTLRGSATEFEGSDNKEQLVSHLGNNHCLKRRVWLKFAGKSASSFRYQPDLCLLTSWSEMNHTFLNHNLVTAVNLLQDSKQYSPHRNFLHLSLM